MQLEILELVATTIFCREKRSFVSPDIIAAGRRGSARGRDE